MTATIDEIYKSSGLQPLLLWGILKSAIVNRYS